MRIEPIELSEPEASAVGELARASGLSVPDVVMLALWHLRKHYDLATAPGLFDVGAKRARRKRIRTCLDCGDALTSRTVTYNGRPSYCDTCDRDTAARCDA